MVENITKWSYLEPLLFKKEWMHLAEISKKLNKNHSVVRKYLNNFENDGLVKKKIIGRMTMYKLNLENPLIIEIISIIEKERILNRKKELVLKEVVEFIHKQNCHALIFGSFAEGKKNPRDIDLLFLGKLDKTKIKSLENRINKKIHLVEVEQITEISETLKEEIKSKHLIISGTEYFIRWLI